MNLSAEKKKQQLPLVLKFILLPISMIDMSLFILFYLVKWIVTFPAWGFRMIGRELKMGPQRIKVQKQISKKNKEEFIHHLQREGYHMERHEFWVKPATRLLIATLKAISKKLFSKLLFWRKKQISPTPILPVPALDQYEKVVYILERNHDIQEVESLIKETENQILKDKLIWYLDILKTSHKYVYMKNTSGVKYTILCYAKGLKENPENFSLFPENTSTTATGTEE